MVEFEFISTDSNLENARLQFHSAGHVTSRHDTTRSMCRAHAFWLCRAGRAGLDTLVTTC